MSGAASPADEAAAAEAASVVEQLTTARDRLATTGPAPGQRWCQAWTAEIDAALGRLAGDGPRLGVVALGSYGRRELAPTSDVDLLLLHDGLPPSSLSAAVRSVVYPLWDAGLAVGYAVRDRREALEAVTDDLTNATAMLDQRTVVGDDRLAQLVRFGLRRRLRRRPDVFLGALHEADLRRRARAGDAAEQLEPDLKDGAGGLRDLQSLRWASAAITGTVGLDPLVAAGYLAAVDRGRLAHAERRLLAARVALQLVSGRGDVLRLEHHVPVARRLGMSRGPEGVHRLLRELFLAARTIDHAHRRAWRLLNADLARGRRRRTRPPERHVDGFGLVDGVLLLPDDVDLDSEDLPHRLLAALTETGAMLDRRSAARLRGRAEAPPTGWRWTPTGRQRALSALWSGRAVLSALAEVDDAGLVSVLLPGWEPVRGRTQRNPYHRYALDRHAWHAVAELGEMVRREAWAANALAEVDDPDAVILAALLHDVGKVLGEPHSETGAPLAARITADTGAWSTTADRVALLTRLHLLLPDTARRRDITDPAVVAEVARQVPDCRVLASLHLLAVADGRATGPAAWSSWTADLVADLVTRVRALLDHRPAGRGHGGRTSTARDAQRLAADLGTESTDVRRHLAGLPGRYPASMPATAVARHTLLADAAAGGAGIRTHVTPGSRGTPDGPGPDRLDVAAVDRPGWFATVVGAVTLHGGRVQGADAFRRADGVAVTTLQVERPPEADHEWWDRVEHRLATVDDPSAITAELAEVARRAERRRRWVPEVDPTVRVRVEGDRRTALVEVHTVDRPGLLHDLAAALTQLGMDILVARIQTVGAEVVDAFTVGEADERELDADRAALVEQVVTRAVAASRCGSAD